MTASSNGFVLLQMNQTRKGGWKVNNPYGDGATGLLDRDLDFKGEWLSPFYLYSCLWEIFNLFLVLETNKVVMFQCERSTPWKTPHL